MSSLRTCCAVVALASCSTTSASLETVWRAPETQTQHLTNVVTFMPSSDGARRRVTEDKLARRLVERGMRATPAYAVISDADMRDRDRAVSALREAGFDGLVGVRLVDTHQALEYPTFDINWGMDWQPYEEPPSVSTTIHMQINAYGLDHRELLWSAVSRSIEPADLDIIVDDLANVASKELAKEHLITAQR